MARKERFEARTIRLELAREHAQLLAARHGVEALGGDQWRAGFPLAGLLEGGDPGVVSLRPEEPVAGEEPIRLRSGQAFSHLRLPALVSAAALGKASTKAQAPGLVQSSKASQAVG